MQKSFQVLNLGRSGVVDVDDLPSAESADRGVVYTLRGEEQYFVGEDLIVLSPGSDAKRIASHGPLWSVELKAGANVGDNTFPSFGYDTGQNTARGSIAVPPVAKRYDGSYTAFDDYSFSVLTLRSFLFGGVTLSQGVLSIRFNTGETNAPSDLSEVIAGWKGPDSDAETNGFDVQMWAINRTKGVTMGLKLDAASGWDRAGYALFSVGDDARVDASGLTLRQFAVMGEEGDELQVLFIPRPTKSTWYTEDEAFTLGRRDPTVTLTEYAHDDYLGIKTTDPTGEDEGKWFLSDTDHLFYQYRRPHERADPQWLQTRLRELDPTAGVFRGFKDSELDAKRWITDNGQFVVYGDKLYKSSAFTAGVDVYLAKSWKQ